jgi:hypothetical protein
MESQMVLGAVEALNLDGVFWHFDTMISIADQHYSRRNSVTITINASWQERI